jgi:hypothetical protein
MGRLIIGLLGLALVYAIGCVGLQQTKISAPGRTTTTAKCSACHPAPQKNSLDLQAINQIFLSHQKAVSLTPVERRAIKDYLQSEY